MNAEQAVAERHNVSGPLNRDVGRRNDEISYCTNFLSPAAVRM